MDWTKWCPHPHDKYTDNRSWDHRAKVCKEKVVLPGVSSKGTTATIMKVFKCYCDPKRSYLVANCVSSWLTMNISVCPGLPLVNLFLVLPSTLKLIKTNKYTLVFSHLNFWYVEITLNFFEDQGSSLGSHYYPRKRKKKAGATNRSKFIWSQNSNSRFIGRQIN